MRFSWSIPNSSILAVLMCVSIAHAGFICDGTDDRLTTGLTGSTFFTSTGATISLWIKPTGTAPAVAHLFEGQGIIGDVDAYYGIYRHNNSGEGDRVNCWGFVASSFEVATTTDNNTWTHIAYVQTGTALTCYKNGVSAGSNTSAASLEVSASGNVNLCDVDEPGVATVFAGEIADVRLFNTALTASQIEVIAASRMHMVGPFNGTAYWPLAQCSDGASGDGVVFVDRTGNGRSLTADNGANNTGMACSGSSLLAWPGGNQ